MGERVWGYTVKGFEMPPLCDEMPPFLVEEDLGDFRISSRRLKMVALALVKAVSAMHFGF